MKLPKRPSRRNPAARPTQETLAVTPAVAAEAAIASQVLMKVVTIITATKTPTTTIRAPSRRLGAASGNLARKHRRKSLTAVRTLHLKPHPPKVSQRVRKAMRTANAVIVAVVVVAAIAIMQQKAGIRILRSRKAAMITMLLRHPQLIHQLTLQYRWRIRITRFDQQSPLAKLRLKRPM